MLIDDEEVKEEKKEDEALPKALESLSSAISLLSKSEKTEEINKTQESILSAIESINKASAKSNNDLARMVVSMQEQNNELLKSLKELKGTDKYDDAVKRTVEAIGKSNDTIAKIKFPDYSGEIKALTQAILNRPTSFEVNFKRSYNGGMIISAVITPSK